MRIRWRGLELPSLVTAERSTLTATYGKFIAEPFERGFGVTIGNSLRRILLSSLEGSAVTQIKLHGAQHEFTTSARRGRRRDRHRAERQVAGGEEPQRADPRGADREEHARARSPAPTSSTDEQVEVINKDHVIATLTEDVPFVMEMVVENGRGYVPATEHTPQAQEIGIIPVDAAFSPVIRVRYEVEETRVGQKTNYDKLTHGDLDQRLGHAGDGPGRVGQDPPQAPQPVRAVQRAGPDGAQRGPRAGRRRASIRPPRPSWT